MGEGGTDSRSREKTSESSQGGPPWLSTLSTHLWEACPDLLRCWMSQGGLPCPHKSPTPNTLTYMYSLDQAPLGPHSLGLTSPK